MGFQRVYRLALNQQLGQLEACITRFGRRGPSKRYAPARYANCLASAMFEAVAPE